MAIETRIRTAEGTDSSVTNDLYEAAKNDKAEGFEQFIASTSVAYNPGTHRLEHHHTVVMVKETADQAEA